MTKTDFDIVTEHIWKNRSNYVDGTYEQSTDWIPLKDPEDEKIICPYFFDFPDYGGIVKSVADKLSSEAVDALQEMWSDIICRDLKGGMYEGFKTIREFRSEYRKTLWALGEKVK